MNHTQHDPHMAGRGGITEVVLQDTQDSTTAPSVETTNPKCPTSERLWRTLGALAAGGEFSNREISEVSGQLNGPDIILRLRKLGWHIHCRLVKVVDRDGKCSRPGRWWLDMEHLGIARQKVTERKGGDLG